MKRDWWRFYDDLPVLDGYAQSWALAFKGGESHDFVVGLVAGRFKAHASFQATCHAIQRLSVRYPQATAIYVEDAANGPAVIDTPKHTVPGLIAVGPHGGKYSRASACEPRVEAGNIYLPRPTVPNGTPIPARA